MTDLFLPKEEKVWGGTRHSRNRNYKAEFASCRLEAVPLEFGDYHPLKLITVSFVKGPSMTFLFHNIIDSVPGSFSFCQR